LTVEKFIIAQSGPSREFGLSSSINWALLV
jgi:hypothetical protein